MLPETSIAASEVFSPYDVINEKTDLLGVFQGFKLNCPRLETRFSSHPRPGSFLSGAVRLQRRGKQHLAASCLKVASDIRMSGEARVPKPCSLSPCKVLLWRGDRGK